MPIVEIHITNIHAREEFRQNSYVSKAAKAVIAGFGVNGYALAITGLAAHGRRQSEKVKSGTRRWQKRRKPRSSIAI